VQAATANLEKSADAIVADTGKRNQQSAKGRTLTKQEFILLPNAGRNAENNRKERLLPER
jgi:hypothetical protein